MNNMKTFGSLPVGSVFIVKDAFRHPSLWRKTTGIVGVLGKSVLIKGIYCIYPTPFQSMQRHGPGYVKYRHEKEPVEVR